MKKLVILPLLILAFSVLSAQVLEDAKELIDNERYESAEIVLEEKLSKDGPQPSLNFLLVKTYLEQDKTEDAKNFVENYKLTSTDPLSRIAYGEYLLSIGKKTEAASLFEEILDKKNKKDADLLIAVAEVNILSEHGDSRKAIELLELAEKRDKKNPQVDVLKGNAYRKLADASNAYVAYRSALLKDPKNVKAHFQMGRIFTSQKNSELYLDHFMKAYAIDSSFAPLLKELYDHYYFKDVKKARKFLEKYIANSDHSLENDYRMTDMLFLTGDFEKAVRSATTILTAQKEKAQPRLYKLMAYSTAGLKDSTGAMKYLNEYFGKEVPEKLIAPDYAFRAELLARENGTEQEVINYYTRAFELDTLVKNKIQYAVELASLNKKIKDYSGQAKWLGFVYENKERKSNVDLFNWGLAHYNAGEYPLADTVFSSYTLKYPDNIFGYYWRAQANAAIDTSLSEGLAIPHYIKAIELGEKDKIKNKNMLSKAYGYLGGYEANTRKDYKASLAWFEKFLELDPANTDALKYKEILEGWIAEGK
jgi:tetratricopeptide (TPR) repeat protein